MAHYSEEAKKKIGARSVPSKDSYFMGCLYIRAACCRDPLIQQAACIIDARGIEVSFGVTSLLNNDTYNSRKFSWRAHEDRKVAIITAIEDVIDKAARGAYSPALSSCEIYSTTPATLKCIRRCSAVGIKSITFGRLEHKPLSDEEIEESKKLAEVFDVKLKLFTGNVNWVRDRILSLPTIF